MSLSLVSIFIINFGQQQYFGFCICTSKCRYVSLCPYHIKPVYPYKTCKYVGYGFSSNHRDEFWNKRLILKNLSNLTGNKCDRDHFYLGFEENLLIKGCVTGSYEMEFRQIPNFSGQLFWRTSVSSSFLGLRVGANALSKRCCPGVFCKKLYRKVLAEFSGKRLCLSLFLIKL